MPAPCSAAQSSPRHRFSWRETEESTRSWLEKIPRCLHKQSLESPGTALLSPHPQKGSFPSPCRQAVNCGSDCYTLMYYGAEAWGFCLKKNKSLHFLSALVMLVSEDLYFPGSPEQHRRADSWERPDLTAGTQASLCGLQTRSADVHQSHTHDEPFTMLGRLSTLRRLCPQCPFFPALLGELLFIVQCLALRALILGRLPRLPSRKILASSFTVLFGGASVAVLRRLIYGCLFRDHFPI